jgi:hypothetical protein
VTTTHSASALFGPVTPDCLLMRVAKYTRRLATDTFRSQSQSLGTIRATIERSFGNYLGGQAKGDQTRELRRLLEQKNALTEQLRYVSYFPNPASLFAHTRLTLSFIYLRNGAAEVEPEEWARFVKLDGRLYVSNFPNPGTLFAHARLTLSLFISERKSGGF